ncbi:unnamed protein product [Prorocentrum cordatum]|uniref:Uncharacterized protein n=1 Tax=Prorocentrum cordatum TaxID=2364126 RepID=A0ABN9PYW6_9DINO|nr:unnamed protein product [Polarella glacialis]
MSAPLAEGSDAKLPLGQCTPLSQASTAPSTPALCPLAEPPCEQPGPKKPPRAEPGARGLTAAAAAGFQPARPLPRQGSEDGLPASPGHPGGGTRGPRLSRRSGAWSARSSASTPWRRECPTSRRPRPRLAAARRRMRRRSCSTPSTSRAWRATSRSVV